MYFKSLQSPLILNRENLL